MRKPLRVKNLMMRFMIRLSNACSLAQAGAVTLIQLFGSAANRNIHLHCLVLDGVYHTTEAGLPVFHTVHAWGSRAR
jgi:hypothetical protein